MPTRLRALLFTLLALGPLLAGCNSRQRVAAPPVWTRTSGLVPLTPSDRDAAGDESDLVRSLADRSRTSNSSNGGKPGKFLALSGGGKFGAYSAGILCGWTATGTRPTFDVVTGVSTGGLIATYAFLGPQYDDELAELYTNTTNRDIFRRRPAPVILFRDSAASSAPLRRMIEERVTEQALRDVAAAHFAGRRLYVGTTSLETRRLVIWDMGAIAASGRPNARDLFCRVLLASASVPGFFPPVPIEVEVNGQKFIEMHVDGGATTGVFLRPATLGLDRTAMKAGQKPLAGSDAYVIVAGKLFTDPKPTDRRTVRIAAGGLQSLLYSQTRGELFRIYTMSALSGINYHLASVPEDVPVENDAMSFDREEMRRLFDAGHAAATGHQAWRDTPPGAEPQEQIRPRTGTQFIAPGK